MSGRKDIDWIAIRAEYASGASLRSLASKYGVSKTYLIEKRDKEQWHRPTDRPDTPTHANVVQLPMPDDARAIARVGLNQLARHLQSGNILPIKDHKSLSDALAQYVKVLMTAPPKEEQHEDGLFIPFSKLSPDARAKIRRVLEEDEAKVRVS